MKKENKTIFLIISIIIITWLVIRGIVMPTDIFIDGSNFSFLADLAAICITGIIIFVIGIIIRITIIALAISVFIIGVLIIRTITIGIIRRVVIICILRVIVFTVGITGRITVSFFACIISVGSVCFMLIRFFKIRWCFRRI